MNLKNLIANKRYGFYVTLALAFMMLVTGIVHAACYSGDFAHFAQFTYNVGVSLLLILGAIIAVALSLFKVTSNYAPWVAGLSTFTSFCLYIKEVYFFVFNCHVDIDYHMEDFYNPIFFIALLLIVITFVLSIVACFLPQIKTEKANESETPSEGVELNEK